MRNFKKFERIFLCLSLITVILAVLQCILCSLQLGLFGSDMLKRSVFPVLYSCVLLCLVGVSLIGIRIKSENIMNSFGLGVNLLALFTLFHFTILIVSVDIEDRDYELRMKRLFSEYSTSNDVPWEKEIVDYIQMTYQCCGMQNAASYGNNQVPQSCCRLGSKACSITSPDVYTQGCSSPVFQSTRIYFGLSIGTFILQILISVIAGYFSGLIFKTYIKQRLFRTEEKLKAGMKDIQESA